jgi:hypothetical protein
VRTKKSYDLVAKYASVFLSGGIVTITPLVVNLGLCAVTLPSLLPQISAGTFSIFSTSMWSNLFYTHPYLYILSYMGIIFVFSGTLATIALAMTFLVNNRFGVALSPFLLYLSVYALTTVLGVYKFSPSAFLTPAQTAFDVNFTTILAEWGFIAILASGTYFIKGMRNDIL